MTKAIELFRISVFAAKKLNKDFEKLSEKGLWEAVMFNTNVILNSDVVKKNRQFKEISGDYFCLLFQMIIDYKPIPDAKTLKDFINKRLIFYNDELNKLISTPIYTPMFVYSTFYQTPLEDEPSFILSISTMHMLSFNSSLLDMINTINDRMDNQTFIN